MTESKVSVAQREKLEAEKLLMYVQAVKIGINTAVEQGLWVAIMVDMLAMSGEVPRDSFLGQQRKNLIELIDTLTKKDLIEGLLDKVSIPNPGYYIFRFLRPLKNELEKEIQVRVEGYVFPYPQVVRTYKEVDPIPRMILTFVFPGALKLLATQIGDIIPG